MWYMWIPHNTKISSLHTYTINLWSSSNILVINVSTTHHQNCFFAHIYNQFIKQFIYSCDSCDKCEHKKTQKHFFANIYNQFMKHFIYSCDTCDYQTTEKLVPCTHRIKLWNSSNMLVINVTTTQHKNCFLAHIWVKCWRTGKTCHLWP